MDLFHKLFFAAFLVLAVAADGVRGYATVSGTVFCDQCKDGERSMFDYPVSGVKVTITCSDANGQILMSREETTNWFGGYVIRFDGTPDLSSCYAQVSDSNGSQQGSSSDCSTAAGPAQKLRLMFRMFDMEMYTVDSLLAQPAQPMSFCPKPTNPIPSPTIPVKPPPVQVAPTRPPPPFRLPPLPPMPPLPPLPPMPPMPFVEASACSHQEWTRPEYRCYWRAVNPDTKVAVVFGPLAGRKYGTDMTLWQALHGRGEAYKTLLREATTSLLNSYNSLQFRYNAVSVITHTNFALMGSQRSALLTALRFIRTNTGSESATCKFIPCK